MSVDQIINKATIEIAGTIDKANRYIAGGVVSLNRKVEPKIVFKKAKGSKLFDEEGNEYIDYHAAFAPFLLGHNFDVVNNAAINALREEWSLMGSGTNHWEARLAELLCESIPSMELVQITNTGSEATAHAIRLSRAFTAREDIIVVLGGYNGWHNEVARAVMPAVEHVGEYISPGEYPFISMSAGIPEATKQKVHVVNFNDLDSVEHVMKSYPIACVITEPVLQNIGVVHPKSGYLEGLLALCEQYGSICIFDEVKTGFRTGLGGYQGLKGLKPHLSVFGKAVANGYPLGVIGGRKDIMQLFDDPNPTRRVLIAGTYNAHPINTAAAIATVEFLQDPSIYQTIESTSNMLYEGLEKIFAEKGLAAVIAKNASAFCAYFCEKLPENLHDILLNHNFEIDKKYRIGLIERGIYHIPIPCKQGSVSYSHSEKDIEKTLEMTRLTLKDI